MHPVANNVIVHNRTNRPYLIGDVEVPAFGWGRVDGGQPFLATLVERGSFKVYTDPPVAPPVLDDPPPAVVEEAPAATKGKSAAKNTPKGDEQ